LAYAGGALYAGGYTFSGAATGSRYLVTLNGTLDGTATNVNFFSGNAASSTATGGQYA